MAALIGPNLGVNYGWAARESGWNTGMDANLKLLDAVLQLSVKSRAQATPPASPANGDRYIVAASPTGAWAGKAGQIAVRIDAGGLSSCRRLAGRASSRTRACSRPTRPLAGAPGWPSETLSSPLETRARGGFRVSGEPHD